MTSKFKFFAAALVLGVFALVASASAATYTWSSTLKQGSKGAAVMDLQKFLNMWPGTQVATSGAGAPGMETSTFGPATKAAVIRFQVANGLTADGIFGAMSAAKAVALQAGGSSYPAGCSSNAGFSTTTGQPCTSGSSMPAGCVAGAMFSSTTGAPCTGGSTNNGSLSGTTGSISTVDTLSTYSNEKVGEGDSNTKVFGVEVEADAGSDLRLTTFKLVLEQTNNSGSDKLNRYLSTVSVWDAAGNKVGSTNASDFSEDGGVYTKTVALSGAVVKADSKAKFYVAVSAIENIDSTDLANNSFTVDLDSIRYTDASGAVLTETTTNSKAFQFQSLATANDLELKVNLSSSNLKAQTVKVSTTSDTNSVELLKFTMKAQGGKMHIDSIPVYLDTSETDLDQVTGNLTLKINGETFDETVSTSATDVATITFNDLNFDIAANETVTGTIYADINDIESSSFDEGTNLVASIRSADISAIDVEDVNGDQLGSGDRSGSATGEAMTFRSTGVNTVMGTPTISYTAGGQGVYDSVTYTIPVSVTSFGNTLYVGQSAILASSNTGSSAFAIAFQKSSAPSTDVVTGVTSTVTLSSSDATIDTAGFRLDDGTTKRFTITVNLFGGNTAAAYRVALKEIATFDNAGLGGTSTESILLPVEQYQTNYQNVTK